MYESDDKILLREVCLEFAARHSVKARKVEIMFCHFSCMEGRLIELMVTMNDFKRSIEDF